MIVSDPEGGCNQFNFILNPMWSQVSALCEACRLLMSEVLLGKHRFNSAEVMVYIGPPTAALLLLGAASREQSAFTATGLLCPLAKLHH